MPNETIKPMSLQAAPERLQTIACPISWTTRVNAKTTPKPISNEGERSDWKLGNSIMNSSKRSPTNTTAMLTKLNQKQTAEPE